MTSFRFFRSFLQMLFSLLIANSAFAKLDALKFLPVQDAGRVKPYDTLARETLQLIYGKQEYNGRPALEVVTTWLLIPDHWDKQKIVQVMHPGLKEALRLDDKEKYFTPIEVFGSERLALVMQELQGFRKGKDRLTPYLQAVQRLEGQLGSYHAFKSGTLLLLIPPTAEEMATQKANPNAMAGPMDRWKSVAELDPEARKVFMQIVNAFVRELPKNSDADKQIAERLQPPGDEVSLSVAVDQLKQLARSRNAQLYPTEDDIKMEVHYSNLHPFRWSWIGYLMGAIAMAIAWQSGRRRYYYAAWFFTGLGFLIHTYGFGLRMYLTGRPPVSNMYESVIWVSWGTILFAGIFEYIYKHRFILLAGLNVAILCLIVADSAPIILDKSLQPLEPVLRSNLWLTIHVLTITISYSAFFLAWGLGNLGLTYFIKGEDRNSKKVRDISLSIYRCLQIGIVLLAAGIILGGVWADYSWGRFWGWDPKEVAALIALLGYLAVLHARLVGWVQNFGMMFWSVICFNLIIMAWYGVNFVLGAGLHSYGFGAGGVQWVAGFMGFHLLYVLYVGYVKRAYEKLKA